MEGSGGFFCSSTTDRENSMNIGGTSGKSAKWMETASLGASGFNGGSFTSA
jgi:hypothetical protein